MVMTTLEIASPLAQTENMHSMKLLGVLILAQKLMHQIQISRCFMTKRIINVWLIVQPHSRMLTKGPPEISAMPISPVHQEDWAVMQQLWHVLISALRVALINYLPIKAPAFPTVLMVHGATLKVLNVKQLATRLLILTPTLLMTTWMIQQVLIFVLLNAQLQTDSKTIQIITV